MTIEKGRQWGSPAIVPGDVILASEDSLVAASPGLRVLPTGGNLWRSLGSPRLKEAGDECTDLPLDVLHCSITGPKGTSEVVAVAQVVVGSWFSRGGLTVVTNVGTWGDMNIAPRAHPNDGEFDVFEIAPHTSLRQRIIARGKAATGTHLPHPTMSVRRGTRVTLERKSNAPLVVDGHVFGNWSCVSVEIRPDFMTVIV